MVVRVVYGSASEWFRAQWADRLRHVIQGATSEPAVVEAANAILAETSGQDSD